MECIFCKIAQGEISSTRVWENEHFLAILDIEPNVEGMTLVIPKDHFSSKVFEMPDDKYANIWEATKEVANLLQGSLEKERTYVVVEGMEVDHAHIKLYPVNPEDGFLRDVLNSRLELEEGDLGRVVKQIEEYLKN